MVDWIGFVGTAKRIDDIDIPMIGAQIGVGEDELHAFMDVEANGSGFDKLGRPKMLFEPHVFYKHLKGTARATAVKAGLAYAKWGEKPYPRDSYPRLLKAVAIDESAALKSASWGLTQILGENFAMVKFATVQAMVQAFMADEQAHLQAAVDFLVAAKIDDEMRDLAKLVRPTTPDDCRPIVRAYNGPRYEKNNYHVKFATAHNKWRGIKDTTWAPEPVKRETVVLPVPDVEPTPAPTTEELIKSVQQLLRDKGYPEAGIVDGKFGNRTRNAILAFEADNALALTGKVTDKLLSELVKAPKREQSIDRENATAKDLKAQGNTTVSLGDNIWKIGIGILTASGLGGVFEGTASFDTIKKGLNDLRSLGEAFGTISPWVIGAVGGGVVLYFGTQIVKSQVNAFREGRSV